MSLRILRDKYKPHLVKKVTLYRQFQWSELKKQLLILFLQGQTIVDYFQNGRHQ